MQKLVKSKSGAIELSIGTIVVVVLAMTMLILGLVLIKGIFDTSTNAVSEIDKQLKGQLAKLFGEDKRVVVYPTGRQVDVRQGKREGFVVAIKNNLPGSNQNSKFSYEVVISDPDVRQKCEVNENEILSLITIGKSGTDIGIASGEIVERLVLFDTEVGDPICTVGFQVNVKVNGNVYYTETMAVNFEA